MAAAGEKWPTVEAVHPEYCALSKLESEGSITFSHYTLKYGNFMSCLAASEEHA